jgi:hypothetical protein
VTFHHCNATLMDRLGVPLKVDQYGLDTGSSLWASTLRARTIHRSQRNLATCSEEFRTQTNSNQKGKGLPLSGEPL